MTAVHDNEARSSGGLRARSGLEDPIGVHGQLVAFALEACRSLRRIRHDCLGLSVRSGQRDSQVWISRRLQSAIHVALAHRQAHAHWGTLPERSERAWSYLNQFFESSTIQPRRCRSEFKTVTLSKCRHTAQLTTCCDPRCRSEHFGGTTANATTRAATGHQPCLHMLSTNLVWS